MLHLATEISGWIGTILIVTAYFLNSRKIVDSQSALYQLMNLAGAAGVGANVLYQRAWPAVALQITWAVISILTLARRRS